MNFKFNNFTSLVHYGSNLGLTVNKGRFSINLKNLIYLLPNYYSMVVGKLLSDGWLERSSLNSNTRFRFKQSLTRTDYVIHSFIILSHYCSNIPYTAKSVRKGNISYTVGFSTRQLPCFNELYELFYKNKIKVIPNNIYELLTPIALAHWIMGDGTILNKGLVLCTDSFSLQEVVKLINVLKIKYDINSTIQGLKNERPSPGGLSHSGSGLLGPRIYILPESMPKLRNLVKPYILNSMYYKLNIK